MSEKQYPISVDGWINCGWNTLRERTVDVYRGVTFLLGYQVILFLIGLIPGGLIVVFVIQISAGLVISLGWLNYCLRLIRGEKVQAGIILEPFNRFLVCWSVSLFLSILVSVGLMLLVLPGIYIMVRYGFSLFSVVDEKLSVTGSMKYSERITKHYGLQLGIFYFIAMSSLYLVTFIYMIRADIVGTLLLVLYHLLFTPALSLIFAAAYDSIGSIFEYVNLDRSA